MGSIVKKITKPVAKFLDKVVPNEIKPALPYVAAAVPFLAPTAGIFGTMAGRAALSGGANILSQLSQEGSEGDFSGLSALLAAGTGALSAPGTATYGPAGPPGSEQIIQSGSPGAADFFAQKAAGMDTGILKSGTEFLGKTAEGLGSMGDILRPGGEAAGLNLATAKAAMVPFAQGSTDLAMATARRALKDYEDELDAFNLQAGQAQEASDSARRAAIISSMTAAAFDQGIIDDTLAQLGLKDGGRVGLETGGTPEDNKKTFADYEKEERIEEFTNLVDKLMTDEGVQDKGYAIRLASDLINMKNKDMDSDRLKFLNERSTLFALPTDKRPEPEYYDALNALEKRVDFRLGGRVGLKDGGDALKEAALNNILYKFGSKYDRPTSSGDSLEDKITEEQLSKVLKYDFQGPAGVMGLEESLDMITPESVSRSARKMQRDGDPDFGGVPEAVKNVEEKPKEFLVDKLKVTVQPGQSEMMGIMNAMMNDVDGVMPEDRKMEFYKLYLPQLYQQGEISKKEYEGLKDELFGEGKADGGLMGLKMGGMPMEMDYRQGGFIPVGSKERADDVPARLSKNEFVMTADAVRAAGGGSVNKGAQRMYQLMNNLEAKV